MEKWIICFLVKGADGPSGAPGLDGIAGLPVSCFLTTLKTINFATISRFVCCSKFVKRVLPSFKKLNCMIVAT